MSRRKKKEKIGRKPLKASKNGRSPEQSRTKKHSQKRRKKAGRDGEWEEKR